MKKIILSFIVSIILFSCAKKEQYYGTWSLYYMDSKAIKITQDSISLNFDEIQWNTYPVTIKNNSLTFLNHTFKTSFSGDSLVFQNFTYKKDTVTPILEIELPKLIAFNFQEPNPDGQLIYIQYGKVPNSDEYKLQLNDLYADSSELINFFFNQMESCSKRALPPRIVFICDKEAKMEGIESIFLEMIKINAHTFYTVNHIEYQVVDNEIKEVYLSQKQKITPIYNIKYETKDDNTVTGFHYLSHSIFERLKTENSQYVFLINNEFYVGKEKYSLEDFTKRIDAIISKNIQLVSLFDLNSDFKHYTILNAVLNDAYKKRYNAVAEQKYNSIYDELSDDEKEELRTLVPRRNIENISIPHFLSFEELSIDLDYVEFPYKNIKEELPEVYVNEIE